MWSIEACPAGISRHVPTRMMTAGQARHYQDHGHGPVLPWRLDLPFIGEHLLHLARQRFQDIR
jgi:hypothetical protein